MVMMPMSWLSGTRFATPLTPLISSLREELYVDSYDSIRWSSHRSNIASVDLYSPHPFILEASFFAIGVYERVHSKRLRKHALDYVYQLMVMEDENTSYQCQVCLPCTFEDGALAVLELRRCTSLILVVDTGSGEQADGNDLSLGARRSLE